MYLHNSVMEWPLEPVLLTCLFLACKVEDVAVSMRAFLEGAAALLPRALEAYRAISAPRADGDDDSDRDDSERSASESDARSRDGRRDPEADAEQPQPTKRARIEQLEDASLQTQYRLMLQRLEGLLVQRLNFHV